MEYILASASPRRAELLRLAGLSFTVFDSGVEENLSKELPIDMYTMGTAELKARATAKQLGGAKMIIAADTALYFKGEILEKPKDTADAARILRALSGKWHEVSTGVVLLYRGKFFAFEERTRVKFRELWENEIERYIKTGEPLDKAGAYAIQGRGALFVERIEGDYCNVVGLPLCRLFKELAEKFGIEQL